MHWNLIRMIAFRKNERDSTVHAHCNAQFFSHKHIYIKQLWPLQWIRTHILLNRRFCNVFYSWPSIVYLAQIYLGMRVSIQAIFLGHQKNEIHFQRNIVSNGWNELIVFAQSIQIMCCEQYSICDIGLKKYLNSVKRIIKAYLKMWYSVWRCCVSYPHSITAICYNICITNSCYEVEELYQYKKVGL